MKIRKRYHLQKKKLKKITEELGDYSFLIPSKAKIEMLEAEPYPIVLVDGQPQVMLVDNKPFPTLKAALNMDLKSKYIVVDMGAVRFMANGADVMSPGIVDADPDLVEGDVVVVVDETHRKPLAVGISLISGSEMVENNKGKAVTTIHFIGDPIWDLEI
ncbi:MAG: RNA-binding protein [Methanobacteriaceae archaeon]|nr:RNA-binding protein [Methanobacteriaceae archaeon]MDP3035584.1 RNA-binding protein [Methanobacteriaceae archaeon]MDP3484351.1 RNA-binding protein [Methanobacteriaceae archaeon]MDP3623225.1 RNA-binding protein [Methanobacteriaceae archaeon]